MFVLGDDKYIFSTDQRMKNYFDMLHDFRYAIESLENDPITCPVLMVLGSRNTDFHNTYKPTYDIIKKWNHISIKYAEGGHDVHNNNPENVAPYINSFLLEKGKELHRSALIVSVIAKVGSMNYLAFS